MPSRRGIRAQYRTGTRIEAAVTGPIFGRLGPLFYDGTRPPPARIRTRGIRTNGTTAYGSYLGCLASKRIDGYGCRVCGRGNQCVMNCLQITEAEGIDAALGA